MTAWHDQPWPRALFTSIQFLTRCPVPGGATRDLSTFREDMARGLGFFPWIGAGIGATSALVFLAASTIFPVPLALVLVLAAEALITGAFHEDAVADFFDAFGGGWTRDDILRILKDSRIGSFGATGLIAALGLRYGALLAFESTFKIAAMLVASGAFGRFAILLAMSLIPPVPQRDGLAKDIGLQADRRALLLGVAGTTVAAIPLFALFPVPSLLLKTLALLVLGMGLLLWFRAYLMRRLGGITGDCLGTVAYAGLILSTLVVAAR